MNIIVTICIILLLTGLIALIILNIIELTVKWKNNTYRNVFWIFVLLSILSQIAKYLYLYGIIK